MYEEIAKYTFEESWLLLLDAIGLRPKNWIKSCGRKERNYPRGQKHQDIKQLSGTVQIFYLTLTSYFSLLTPWFIPYMVDMMQ